MQTNNSDKVTISAQVDRRLIPADQASERYLLLLIQAPNAPQQENRLPLNLSLVVDRSGSMSGDKLEYVKEAAIHVLRLLTEQDRVSVVIYDDEVELLSSSRALTAAARNDLIQRLRQVHPGGMTNLSGGWFTGCDEIASYMTGDYLNRALLLTDGLANRGLTDHERLVHEAKELRRRGISTTTFGVGEDFNQFLLQGIADGGGGHFYFIDRPNQIPNYFQGELGELLTTVAREITLEVGTPEGVELELLNDAPMEQAGAKARIFLGDAYANEARVLVLKVKLPARSTGQDISLPVSLRYEDARQRRAVPVESETVRFVIADSTAAEKQPVDQDVLTEAGRLEAERAKMEALKKEQSGDVAGAQEALRRAGVVLSAMPPVAAAPKLMDELEEMGEEIERGMSKAQQKARHYATYLGQRSRKDYKK